MMETSTRFRDFVSQLLQREGALVEHARPDILEVLAPPHVRQALRLSDFERLSFRAEPQPKAQQVTLESDWLERLGEMLGQRGAKASCVLRCPAAPPSAPERILQHAVSLQNAVYDLTNIRSAWTRYFILLFRYTAVSDVERDGLLTLGLNTANGAIVEEAAAHDLLAAVEIMDHQAVFPPDSELPRRWTNQRLNRWSRQAVNNSLELHLAPFIKGLQRRLNRDLTRVRDYYSDLQRESLVRLQKRDGEARERLRLESIQREYGAKVEDLKQKYALRVEVSLSQTLELIMPVQRFELIIKRRKAQRRVYLDWNPLLRKLDSPRCEHTFSTEVSRVVCDDKLHLVSPAAHGPCAKCEKAYCRACHPRTCPRCKHAS